MSIIAIAMRSTTATVLSDSAAREPEDDKKGSDDSEPQAMAGKLLDVQKSFLFDRIRTVAAISGNEAFAMAVLNSVLVARPPIRDYDHLVDKDLDGSLANIHTQLARMAPVNVDMTHQTVAFAGWSPEAKQMRGCVFIQTDPAIGFKRTEIPCGATYAQPASGTFDALAQQTDEDFIRLATAQCALCHAQGLSAGGKILRYDFSEALAQVRCIADLATLHVGLQEHGAAGAGESVAKT